MSPRSSSISAAPRAAAAAMLALACALLLGGCVSLLPKAKPVQLYRFGGDRARPSPAGTIAVGRAPASGAVLGVGSLGVVLLTPSLPRAAVGDGILTLSGDKAAYIAGARWLGPAATLFQEDAQAAFEARAQRVRLVDRSQLSLAGALLRLEVSRFEVRYDTGAPVVAVALRATLASSDGAASVQQSFARAEPAGADRVAAIVAAFDRATDAVLDGVVDWTDASALTLVPHGASPALAPTPTPTGESKP